MSQFSNQLQAAMEETGITQVVMAEKTDVSQSQVSRYVNGENRPELEPFEKICALFPQEQRTKLLVSYLVDDVPERFRNLVSVEPAKAGLRTAEEPGSYVARMPKRLRAAYDGIGLAALESSRIAQVIMTTHDLWRRGRDSK